MQYVLIFLLSILAAIVYGIVHDQITARICVEYFTVYHPPVFGDLKDPTLLAFGWGVIATWWVGAILGVPLALAARVGNMPKRSAVSMIGPIGVLLGVMGICAFCAGLVGYLFAHARPEMVVANDLPAEKQAPFLADALAHLTSYGVGFLGGLALIGWTIWARYQEMVRQRLSGLRQMKSPGG